MEFVGKYLKSIRIQQNCTIQELADELKINKSLINSIELDDYPEYLNPVYIIGHIRSYANFFDLDADDLIETFKIQISYNKLSENRYISKPVKNISLLSFTKTFYFSSIAIIAFTFYFMFVRPNSLGLEYAMTPDLPEDLKYNLEKIEMDLSLSQKKAKDLKIFSSSVYQKIANSEEQQDSFHLHLNDNYFSEKNLFNSSSAVASNSKNISLKDADNKITLHILNPTWIQLRDINDNIIFSKLMNEGEEYSYYTLEKLHLTAGNAGNIVVSLNGIVKGKVGRAGDVIDSLVIDKNFSN
jgi:cytoskeletal protein RodZ